jgi:hypothetical protein
MDKQEALERYKKSIDTDIIKYYEDADKYQWYNLDDPDLHPIRTKLPECPDWDKIENFGLPKEKQVFKREEMPSTLEYLIKKVRLEIRRDRTIVSIQKQEDAFYDKIWTELEGSIKYRKAVEWIEEQWYYRIFGKWFFINGKPTYIPKNQWFYLNYWHIEGVGLPEYRDRDRRWFWVLEYFKEDTTMPEKDAEGNLLRNDDGSLKLVDVGYRTVDGVIGTKGRRMGDTTKATDDMTADLLLVVDGKGGIQGDKEDTGKQVFDEKLMYAYRKLPFFWRPKMNHNVQNELILESNDPDESLDTKIDYASAHPTAYDGRRLDYYYADEPGKLERYSIYDRHDVVRRCMRKGAKLTGFSLYTTTVNDMTATAGIEFEKLCRDSFYQDRGKNGFTRSGMVVIHYKAYDGYEGFIGKYGESIINEPTEEQLKYVTHKLRNQDGKYVGAKDFIELEREMYRESGQYEKVSLHKRLYPMSFAETFAPPAENIFFNTDILEERINQLKRDNTATVRGDFVGDPEVSVNFVPNNEGRFYVSKLLPHAASNRKYKQYDSWYPADTSSYISSSDAFRLEKTQGYRMSLGSGAVKEKNALFCCTYLYRPETIDEYCFDMLKMTVYWNALHYPETNVNHVAEYFIKRGFKGYLLFDTDPDTGKPSVNPGFHMGIDKKQKMFNKHRDYISMNGMKEKHIEYLMECATIRGLDDTTNKDLFVATGGCLLGEESSYGEYLKEDEAYDIKGAIW